MQEVIQTSRSESTAMINRFSNLQNFSYFFETCHIYPVVTLIKRTQWKPFWSKPSATCLKIGNRQPLVAILCPGDLAQYQQGSSSHISDHMTVQSLKTAKLFVWPLWNLHWFWNGLAISKTGFKMSTVWSGHVKRPADFVNINDFCCVCNQYEHNAIIICDFLHDYLNTYLL